MNRVAASRIAASRVAASRMRHLVLRHPAFRRQFRHHDARAGLSVALIAQRLLALPQHCRGGPPGPLSGASFACGPCARVVGTP